MNRLSMQKLNKLVYCHYNLKLRCRTKERRSTDDLSYCLINLDHIFRGDDPLLPWIAKIEDPLPDLDMGFQQQVQDLIDEDMAEAEGQPCQEEGTSARLSKGKEPAHIVPSSDKSSSIVSSNSHGGGDGGDGGDSGIGGTSKFYQHDEEDAILVEDVM